MKKIFWSLAALMMLMAAPMMTSCSNDLEEVAPAEEVKENVVTLTIKMPEQAETRVGVDGGTLKLTGWEENDVVKVYYVHVSGDPVLDGGIPFTCTDPAEGTFTGTLPAGKTLNDYNFAMYGHDVEVVDHGYFAGFFDNMVSSNLKDVVILGGEISEGTCTMSIHNNVIKVTNYGDPVTVAWHDNSSHFGKLLYKTCDSDHFIPVTTGVCGHGNFLEETTFADADPITIPEGISYIFMPATDVAVGLYTEGGVAVVPAKAHTEKVGGNTRGTVGKLYKITLATPPICAMTWAEAEAAVPSNFVSMSKEDAVAFANKKKQYEGRPGYILIYEHVAGNIYRYIVSDGSEGYGEIGDFNDIGKQYNSWLELFNCENAGYNECYWFTVSK